jgi:nucleotide-binding universal stress UspA family protein
MLTIKHILFPIDFSERTCGALPFVNAMASRFGSHVTLISVAPPIPFGGMVDPSGLVVMYPEDLKSDLQARLDTTLVKEFEHLPVQRIAEVGDPARVITRFAHSEGVDLIMMPTHGYGPFRRLLLGSVTAKVLHDAQCPVWTGAHMEKPPFHEHLAWRSVLCAVDGTPKSTPVMEWAAQFSKETGAALRLVHAVPGAEAWPDRQFNSEFESDLRKAARERIECLQRSVGVKAPLCIATGEVAETARDEARRHGADLIVIGRGVLDEALGRLRTHAYGIIRQAPCPVISV